MWQKLLSVFQLVGLATIGALLVLLKLRDRQIQSLKLEMVKTRFRFEDEDAEKELARLRKELDGAKASLHTAPRE